ncbi:glycine-rich domain-containing protein [Rhodovulum sulfidophilum]|uniref:glycine-rich domain-containing protein n=1 Tax=Rhodovulum sulfidophilum TaxID=35806 RepID=UPI000951DBC0|nr:hypothetical protein [Rhodovulum sulfidophilum]MBL3554186.1 hypothetical protein [Rhodovulum sulfidophilum]OLS48448.1 hypothetical protein BV379_09295 [Rhodovulum sulfidophilum]
MDVAINSDWTSRKEELARDAALLGRIMDYDHPALKERMIAKVGWSEDFTDELFNEMKRFLYLCATNEGSMAPPEDIDEIWHNFILFTVDYAEFCRDKVGTFLHHQPLTVKQRAESDGSMVERTLSAARASFGDTLSKNWEFSKIPGSCGPGTCGASTNCQDVSGCFSGPKK